MYIAPVGGGQKTGDKKSGDKMAGTKCHAAICDMGFKCATVNFAL